MIQDAFSFVYACNAIAAFFKFMPALLNGKLTGNFHHFKNPETIQHLIIFTHTCFSLQAKALAPTIFASDCAMVSSTDSSGMEMVISNPP